jgi:cation diffusion facilitator CzcD-associated flavoprotein CzcO
VEVISYLNQYADEFLLNKHIFLNQEVLLARQLSNDKWEIISQNFKTNEKKVETFDFLIVTSGKYSDPDTPHILNSKDFNGIQMYDSEFNQNDQRLASKKIAVVK